MKTPIVWPLVAGIGIFFMTVCMNTITAKEGDEDIVWRRTKAYDKRVASFAIEPEKAFQNRWYWFGRETKTDAPLEG